MYILTGFIPVEGQIHIKALTIFNNICRQENTSLEKRIAYRQLTTKDDNSCSWLMTVRRILHKYGLPNPKSLLDEPMSKLEWKRQIKTAVNSYWKDRVITDSELYSSLAYLNCDSYQPGKIHRLLQINTDPTRESTRILVKLKLVTDTYILQDKRSRFHGQNQNVLCYVCSEANETVEHFILQCKVLESIRQSVISEIDSVCLERYNRSFYDHPVTLQLQFILEASKVHEDIDI